MLIYDEQRDFSISVKKCTKILFQNDSYKSTWISVLWLEFISKETPQSKNISYTTELKQTTILTMWWTWMKNSCILKSFI